MSDRAPAAVVAIAGRQPYARACPFGLLPTGVTRFQDSEMDLVAHCGDVGAGSFVHTLCMTDVAAG